MDDTDQRRIDAGNDIDLKWLRSFVVVAEEASFTRAASVFHDRYPGVVVTLAEDNSDRLVERLRDSQLDLALIGWAGQTPPDIDTVVIVDEELVAVAGPGHPLADAGPLTISQLCDVPLVTLPRGTGVRAALDAACAEAGFTPRIAFEASALPMVIQLASRGLGLAVVPSSIPNGPGILPIIRPPLRSRLELAWLRAPSANPAARALIEQARALGPPGRPVS
jgi:DNA-binding transcriptional LysR family regulator